MTAHRRKPADPTARLSAAQRAGDEPITLPDGRWYYATADDAGNAVTDPAQCDIWEKDADGRDVMYVTQARLAEWLGISTRWVQKLEARGLPARGRRETCAYPTPHALTWWTQYRLSMRDGADPLQSSKRLTMAEAWARHDRQQKVEEADIDYHIATDALFAKYMKASEKNDHKLSNRLLEELWARDGRPDPVTAQGRRHVASR